MSDSDEVADGQELAIEMARELYKANPDHDLLRLFPKTELTDEEYDPIWEEFQQHFGKPGISREVRATYPAQAYFWAKYFLALRKAVEELAPQALSA